MNKLNIKRAIFSSLIVWTLGAISFILSYFVEIMDDPHVQANIALSVALIPISLFAAHVYYKKSSEPNGILLGSFMFLIATLLDATITVPIFIAPIGGDHLSFFGDPSFWLIGVEYILVVTAYWKVRKLMIFRHRTVN